MEIKDILTLIKAVSDSKLAAFSYEEGETKLQFEVKDKNVVAMSSAKVEEGILTQAIDTIDRPSEDLLDITSPMVGTFYCSASEGGEPFVAVGETVRKGQVVGIVEAMKLMNEIESPYDGIVEKVLVHNKDMVGFGDVILKIKPIE